MGKWVNEHLLQVGVFDRLHTVCRCHDVGVVDQSSSTKVAPSAISVIFADAHNPRPSVSINSKGYSSHDFLPTSFFCKKILNFKTFANVKFTL